MVEPRRLRFAGYAAIFDRVDNGGDVIRPGAFRASLERQRDIPLLWQHKPGRVIGTIEQVREDRRGLRVIGRLEGGEQARELAGLVEGGRINGLSFGYQVRQAARRDGVRELIDLELLEVSVVTRPMQPLARVHAVEG